MNTVPPRTPKGPGSRKFKLSGASRYLNKPQVTLAAVAIAIALGLSRLPMVETLRPIGETYLALLQMSVLPFLLAAIPLAIRSAIGQGAARRILIGFAIWLFVFTALIAAIGILVSVLVFGLYPIGAHTIASVGGLVGDASGQVDIEYIMDLATASSATEQLIRTNGLAELVPANIFAALSGNQITGVLVFTGIFGVSMAVTERRTGNSFFSELKHLHDVCLLIFEWLNLFVPVAIVALIAPQIAQLGSDVLLVLAQFLLLFAACSFLLIGVSIVLIAWAVKAPLGRTFSEMMKPLTLVAATRNSIACIPLGIEVMTKDLHASRAGCELFIPLGFTIFRFGYILHFAATTIFIGALLSRDFSMSEMLLIGVLSTLASFGTIGLNGPAGLAALAAVLRPFALSFELALPILIIVDPIIGMLRASVTVAVTCAIAALSCGRQQGEDILLAPAAELVPSK
jgi:proton glutamate symport protein